MFGNRTQMLLQHDARDCASSPLEAFVAQLTGGIQFIIKQVGLDQNTNIK